MDLHTLPAPYPDETWYSIVARYHRKSGNIKSIMTRKDLFGESARKAINPLAMDYTIADYIRLHGPTLGTAEECFSKYTLAPYQMRYYSKERKEEVLERILSENEQEKTSVFTSHMHSRNQTKLGAVNTLHHVLDGLTPKSLPFWMKRFLHFRDMLFQFVGRKMLSI